MIKIDELQRIIEKIIEQYSWPEKPELLYNPIEYILQIGGKRVRPALLLMAYNLYHDNVDDASNAALAIEVFHNFTLLHDDIMDKSSIRRGKPTVHKQWNDNVAILSGDAMSIIANNLLLSSPQKNTLDALQVFNKTAVEVCEGQQYDMDFETRINVQEAEYMEMIRLKTSVLVAAALKIGAILADAPNEDAENLYQFGENLGLAFQLQDDFLDSFGNQQTFGKRIGGDILANKKTFISIKALETATGNQLERLKFWMADNENKEPEKKIAEVKQIFLDLKLDELIQQKMMEYHSKAIEDLKAVKIPEEKKAQLYVFADQLKSRKK